jgi:hypothetical protein
MAKGETWVELVDGAASVMGDGVLVVCQRDGRVAQSVVLTVNDLRAMLAAAGADG